MIKGTFRHSRVRSLLLLLLSIAALTCLPRGLVVCIAQDDHVRVESHLEFVSCQPVLSTSTRSAADVPRETCTDLPLLGRIARLADGEELPTVAPPIIHVAAHTVDPVPARPLISRPRSAEPRPFATLASIRTTVLLI